MGQRGRAPAPVKLQVLRGETRPSRLAAAPKPQDPPECPADLAPEAALIWRATLHAVASSRHIGVAHAQTFRAFCETAAAANAMNPKGTKEWRELVNTNRQLARELCLTPATGAHLQTAEPADPLAEFVAG